MSEQDTQEAPQVEENEANTESETQEEQPLTFDAWLGKQDDTIKKLVGSHTSGLKSALDSERDERKKLQRQIKELSKHAEDGSEMRQQLDKLSTDLETTDRRATFYEEAHSNKVTNLRLAWIAAQEGELIDSRGRIDWDGFKAAYPELIERPATVTPRSNAGNGTGAPPARAQDMNSIIRTMAGRR